MRTSETNEMIDEAMDKLTETGPLEEEVIDGTKEVLTENAGDPEQVKNAEVKIEQRERQDMFDVQWLLSDVRGRRFLWKYLEKCKPFATGFIPDPLELQFKMGQRNIGSDILNDIMGADSTALAKMMTEFRGEIANGNRKRKRK